ncbi:hypothetical protein DPMN_126338 [Dreissena polymorpha]|uniref:CUB domain-containing protein n=1 Tax=Dreissena polymorpha TaxID=45954 RepID=A0A9D4GZV0_DREPO|nr:hypothetical protein DPMN_126338 [Dreissena polymorpha]
MSLVGGHHTGQYRNAGTHFLFTYNAASGSEEPNKLQNTHTDTLSFFIELYFTDTFAIEESEGCKKDYVVLRDGPFGYWDLIARFCGNEFPVAVQTISRFLWA